MTIRSVDHAGRAGAPWLPWLLGLALLGALVGPIIYRDRMGAWRFDRLYTEARRVGGRAGIPEGGYDFAWKDTNVDLDLTGARVDDDELARLVAMPAFRHVRTMSLAGTAVTDKGISLLRNAVDLNALDLSRTAVTDDCLETLATFPILNTILLSGTRVSDAGLETYVGKAVGSSNIIDVTDTAVTEEGVRKLFSKFGRWNIVHGSSKNPVYTR